MIQILGPNDLQEQVLNKDLCVRCGACVGLCPYFNTYKGDVVMTFSCDHTQGRCFTHCPRTDVDYDLLSKQMFGKLYDKNPLGVHRKIFASKAGDKMGDHHYQNGGTITALMVYAMEQGLIDAAVLTDSQNLIPVPKLVTETDGIKNCSSTKYMAAPTISKLNEGMKKGYEKIGVVGTPCQMTAIAKMKSNPLNFKNFKNPTRLLIGLFCTWAVDTKDFINLVSRETDISKIEGMDILPPPAQLFILKTKDQNIEIPLDAIRNIVPKGCSMCPDMTSEWADISVGAFEGESTWNTLIIRTPKGENLVNDAVNDGYLVTKNLSEKNLAHLIKGAENKKKRGFENQKKDQPIRD